MQSDLGKLFIGGISWDTDEERLEEYFSTYGEVIETVIMKDRTTGRARGFGFVVFTDPAVADRVIKEKHLIDGRLVEAKKAVPRDDQSPIASRNINIQGSPVPTRTRKIFVGGLASTVTENDFKNHFEQFGTITDVVVMYDQNTRRPRGFGFITYDSEEAVEKVLVNTFHELNGKMVEVKRAVPKELSPSPTRTPLSGYGGLSRINSLFNEFPPNNIGYGLRFDGRYNPMTAGRSGFDPFSPGYNMALNFEPGMNPNFSGNPGYGRSLNPYYNSNRFSGAIGFDGGNGGGNSSFFSSTNRNLWGNVGSGSGSIGGGTFGNNGANWGSEISGQGGGNLLSSSANLGYSNNDGNYAYSRNGGTSVGPIGSNGGYDARISEAYGSGSVYGDATWRLANLEREVPGSNLGYALGGGISSDAQIKNSPGYVGAGYSVTKRQPNRGIVG
jgi:RNA-binding protein Musashi